MIQYTGGTPNPVGPPAQEQSCYSPWCARPRPAVLVHQHEPEPAPADRHRVVAGLDVKLSSWLDTVASFCQYLSVNHPSRAAAARPAVSVHRAAALRFMLMPLRGLLLLLSWTWLCVVLQAKAVKLNCGHVTAGFLNDIAANVRLRLSKLTKILTPAFSSRCASRLS